MTNLDHDEKATLLLVDDDEDFLNVLAIAMRKRGFTVSLATSAESAIELAKITRRNLQWLTSRCQAIPDWYW